MAAKTSTGSAIKTVVVAFVVGVIALFAGGYAVQKIATLQQKPILVPLLIAGAAVLLLKRRRMAAGAGLAGAAGALGLMQFQAAELQKSGDGQTAGRYGDAGRYSMRSGWAERPAGALGGAGARRIVQQQQALGPGEAGSLQGTGAKRVLRSQDAMGLVA